MGQLTYLCTIEVLRRSIKIELENGHCDPCSVVPRLLGADHDPIYYSTAPTNNYLV